MRPVPVEYTTRASRSAIGVGSVLTDGPTAVATCSRDGSSVRLPGPSTRSRRRPGDTSTAYARRSRPNRRETTTHSATADAPPIVRARTARAHTAPPSPGIREPAERTCDQTVTFAMYSPAPIGRSLLTSSTFGCVRRIPNDEVSVATAIRTRVSEIRARLSRAVSVSRHSSSDEFRILAPSHARGFSRVARPESCSSHARESRLKTAAGSSVGQRLRGLAESRS